MNPLPQLLRMTRKVQRSSAVGNWLKRIGVTQLAKSYYVKSLIKTGHHDVTILGQPLRFVVDTTTEIDRVDRFYQEEEMAKRLLDSLAPNDVVFDVGANIGVITLIVASADRSKGVKVHAFEPEPRNAQRLQENVSANKFNDAVTVHTLGFADHRGTATLHVAGEVGNGTNSLVTAPEGANVTIQIELMRGDEFVAEKGVSPTVLKIDVEGAEWDVLQGMDGVLGSRSVREIFIELHPLLLKERGVTSEQLLKWLEDRGYKISWKHDRNTEMHCHLVQNTA